jgi:DnaD/phage-associated family protein
MPRKRDLRPSFFSNEYLAELPFEARLLFAGLWTIADRRGRLEDRPIRIKGALFPYDNINVDDLLQSLADSDDKFITRYIVDGKKYIQINNFEKNQHIHKDEVESTIPSPSEHQPVVVEAPLDSGGCIKPQPDEHHPNTPSSFYLLSCSLEACSHVADDDTRVCAREEEPASASAGGVRDGGIAIKSYLNHIQPDAHGTVIDKLCSWIDVFPEDVIVRAIDEAVVHNKRSYKYIEGILKGWKKAGLTSLSLVEGHLNAWEEKNQKPRDDPKNATGKKSKFADYEGRKWDFDELDRLVSENNCQGVIDDG